MNIDKQIIADLFQVIQSQNAVISYLAATEYALVNTFANESALPTFVSVFRKHLDFAAKHPQGELAKSLVELHRMLAEVGEKLKRDTGAWEN